MISVADAIYFLHACYIPRSVGEAVTYLEEKSSCITLLNLYRHYFPTEWDSDTTSWHQDSSDAHSPRELEFLRLVDEQLFPLPDWVIYENDERLHNIPVVPHDLDSFNENLEDLPLVYQFALSLIGHGFDASEWTFQFQFHHEDLLLIKQVDWDKLKALCQKAPTPLNYLWLVFEVLDHDTGCIWLDSNVEMMPEVEWTVENMDLLHKHWQQATLIFHQVEQLDKWLKADRSRLRDVIKLWNLAREKPKRRQPKALIDVL